MFGYRFPELFFHRDQQEAIEEQGEATDEIEPIPNEIMCDFEKGFH